VTLISAPAGFGKTTLASEWVAACERLEPKIRTAWLSLDEGDNDPARFLAYLVAALRTIAPSIGAGVSGALDAAQPPPPPTEAMLTALLNDITAVPDHFVLVLDDYHVIEAQAVDRALTFLLEHLPPQMRLVIATREDPHLPLARLRARGQLTELRATDLRFSLAEAAGFLNQVMGLGLAADDIAALETRTEGWIAGLQLAALALQKTLAAPGQPDASAFIQSFTGSHRFVLDYLVEEVLQQQPAGVQSFLLRTSLLDRLCGPLCDAVLLDPSASGQGTLEYLERANLLVVPLDDRREWYRYHHLFAGVLQARLRQEQPDQVASLHRRACAWWEQNGFRADAIHHALAARDFERAADLIEQERSANVGTYLQSATWLGWVRTLPDELVRARPKLAVGFAWELLFAGELEAAEARLRDAERLLEPRADRRDPSEAASAGTVLVSDEDARSLRASLAIARAFHAQALGDAAGTASHARRALALVPEASHYLRGLASAQLGLACWANGDLEPAFEHMAEAMARLQRAGSLLYATTCAYVLTDIRIAQGRLSDAAQICADALRLVTAQGGPVIQGTADLYLGLSEVCRERGEVEAAREHRLKSEALGKPAALDEWPYGLYLAQARLKQDQGDLDGALALLDAAERLYHRNPVPNVRPVAALRARVWLGQGRLAEALAWAQRRGLSVGDDLSYLREFEHLTLARVLIARYQRDGSEQPLQEAVGLLERLLKAAEDGGRLGSVIEILVLQALAHQAHGNLPLALVPLERALALAEPEGYVRLFVDEGPPMRELLTRLSAAREGESPGAATGLRQPDRALSEAASRHVHRVLAAFGEPEALQPSAPAPVQGSSPQPLAEPLSEREREVLRLLGTEMSGPEIARELLVSLNTLHTHTKNIYTKLGVNNRRAAVRRAKELDLA
jgi:LuxR family maltose regulon positive regulatory protein